MRPIFYFFIIPVFALCSCDSQDREISMVGKWYHISGNGYAELEIDSQYVVAFSEKLGKSKLEYKIENDSFKYITINYSAKIIPKGDSVIILRSSGNRDETLIRFNESVNTFESVPNENDSLKFILYERNFSERAYQALVKAGFIRKE